MALGTGVIPFWVLMCKCEPATKPEKEHTNKECPFYNGKEKQ